MIKRKPYLSEDWTAVVVAFIVIAVAILGFGPTLPSVRWSDAADLRGSLGAGGLLESVLVLWIFGFIVTSIAFVLKGDGFSVRHIFGYTVIVVIALLSQLITGNEIVRGLGLEIVLFSLFIGLFISNVLRVPAWIGPLIQTELYIKIGLVILGCGIVFSEVMRTGALGLVQSLAVVLVVWQFCFWLGKRFGLDDELRTMLSSAVAICGVSAAIATAGAIKGDSKKLSYVISLVLITAIPMMLVMPWIAKVSGMSMAVAGAWLGGTIDTTGAVVAAGTVLGDDALSYATVVKFSQNFLLGIAAFAISVYWTYRKSSGQSEKPSARTIWDRFPKFVLGFIVASFLFSFVLPNQGQEVKSSLKGIQTFWFALAFTCIGLETKFTDIFSMDNGRPAIAFLVAQLFNIGFTLLVALLVFG